MTTAERLVRKLCEVAVERVRRQENEADEAVDAKTPLAEASAAVQRAIATLQRTRPLVAEAEAVIKEAGFEVPNLTRRPTALSPCYSCTNKKKQANSARRQKRIQQINEIQTSMLVKVYGKDPKVVGQHLRTLELALAKV